MHTGFNLSTGFISKNNKPISIGDVVRTPDGFQGTVCFAYGAYRVDITKHLDGTHLQYNSSLLFCDRHKPWEMEVVFTRKGLPSNFTEESP